MLRMRTRAGWLLKVVDLVAKSPGIVYALVHKLAVDVQDLIAVYSYYFACANLPFSCCVERPCHSSTYLIGLSSNCSSDVAITIQVSTINYTPAVFSCTWRESRVVFADDWCELITGDVNQWHRNGWQMYQIWAGRWWIQRKSQPSCNDSPWFSSWGVFLFYRRPLLLLLQLRARCRTSGKTVVLENWV